MQWVGKFAWRSHANLPTHCIIWKSSPVPALRYFMLWYDDRTIVTFLALLFIICRAGVVRVAISHNEVLRKENRSMAMEFGGTQTIAAPVPQVWAFLMDVNNVAECAPGFQSLEVLGDEHWKATISVGVGPVKARFVMDVTRPEVQ